MKCEIRCKFEKIFSISDKSIVSIIKTLLRFLLKLSADESRSSYVVIDKDATVIKISVAIATKATILEALFIV